MKNSSAYAIPAGLSQSTSQLRIRVEHKAVEPLTQSIAKLASAVGLSIVGGWSVLSFVSFCYDWGYELLKAVCGQPESGQGVFAGMSLWFGVMPFAFAFIFGYLKRTLHGENYWRVVPAIAVLGTITAEVLVDSDASAIVEMAPWAVLSCLLAYLGYWLSAKLMDSIHDPLSKRLIPAGAIACVPAGVITAFSGELNYHLEIAICSAAILSTAAFIAKRCPSHFSLSRRLQVVGTTMLPIVIPLTLTLVAVVVSVFLDQFEIGADLGWRAPLSAAVLLIFTGLNAAIGTGLGYMFRDLRNDSETFMKHC